MKAEVGNLDINNLVIVPTGWIIFKQKLNDIDVDKLKSIPVDLKKLSDAVSKQIVKKDSVKRTKYDRKENCWCNYFYSFMSI